MYKNTPFSCQQNHYKIQLISDLFCGKVKINVIGKPALASLQLLVCGVRMIWKYFRHKWGTCTLIGHHKWLVEKWGMGNIYNQAALGLILFPLKWKKKTITVCLHKEESQLGITTWHKGGAKGVECIFCFCDFVFCVRRETNNIH